MLKQVRQDVPWNACLPPVFIKGAFLHVPWMQTSSTWWWVRSIQTPASSNANVRVWCRLCKKPSRKAFPCVVCVCVYYTLPLTLFLFPTACWGIASSRLRCVLHPASETSQSFQINTIILKAAEGGRATTAQKTMPDWRVQVRACEKIDFLFAWSNGNKLLIGKVKAPCSYLALWENPPAVGGEPVRSSHSS